MKNTILYLIILFAFSRCSDFAIKKKIIDNYYIVAGDDDADATLSYHASKPKDTYGGTLFGGAIIEATVFAAGYNDNYIIAKQHPRVFPNPPNKSITNYYILPLKKEMNWRTKNGLIGPLTLEQFNKQRKKLGIGDGVTFTTVIHEFE